MNVTEEEYYKIPDLNPYAVEFRRSGLAIKDEHYFNDVIVNPRILINMIKHSLSSKNEILGLLLGSFDIKAHTYHLTDTIIYPTSKSSGYSVQTDDASLVKGSNRAIFLNQLGRPEDYVGWYHSHPNLHCFYSMIDVRQHRIHWGPKGGTVVGLVIDPINTMVSAHLNLGAYSTVKDETARGLPPPTTAVIKKYGTAANHYYQLNIHYFCSKSDKVVLNDIIAKSYGTALQASPLSTNAKYLIDSEEKSKEEVGDGDKDPLELKDIISSVNSDRKTGLWIHRKKRLVFG